MLITIRFVLSIVINIMVVEGGGGLGRPRRGEADDRDEEEVRGGPEEGRAARRIAQYVQHHDITIHTYIHMYIHIWYALLLYMVVICVYMYIYIYMHMRDTIYIYT